MFHCISTPCPVGILPHLGQAFAQAEIVPLDGSDQARLISPQGTAPVNWLGTIDWLRQHRFAAVILTEPGQSPYTLGDLCYPAGIPVRVGRSPEFGGQVLTHCLTVAEVAAIKAQRVEVALRECVGNSGSDLRLKTHPATATTEMLPFRPSLRSEGKKELQIPGNQAIAPK